MLVIGPHVMFFKMLEFKSLPYTKYPDDVVGIYIHKTTAKKNRLPIKESYQTFTILYELYFIEISVDTIYKCVYHL
jgi:hypothetical protein